MCAELSADVSGLLTLSLHENNAEGSRESNGICMLKTATYSMMTQRLNTQKHTSVMMWAAGTIR